jgi:uncharacterized membrane protein (DUF485 family)
MVESTNATGHPSQPEPRDRHAGTTRDARAIIVRTRLIVASTCALITLAVTVAFFTVMSSGAPFMSRVVFGRSITLANVLGVGIILFYLATVLVFERFTSRAGARRLG